jgi:AcrR family transcriptional regulator
MAEDNDRASRARVSAVEKRIVAAAIRLFAEQGFDGTSVQEIVEEASVTKGALYHYFESKNDLLFEIYHTLISRQLAGLDRILGARLTPTETVRALITDLVESTAGYIDEVKVWVREMHKLDDQRMDAVRAERRRYHVAFRTVIEDAQRDGVFSTVASAGTVTFIVFGVINEMPLWYQAGGPKSPAEIAAEVSAFVLAGLDPAVRSDYDGTPGDRSVMRS